MLEFLDLPEPYKEYDLKKAILRNMKKFLLEFGRDFIFMGEEYHLQVGKSAVPVPLPYTFPGRQASNRITALHPILSLN